MENEIHCPKCNSTQITAGKKGFSGKKAIAGALLTGGIGLLAGTIGSGKVIITCLNCGNRFKPGEKPKPERNPKIIWDESTKSHIKNPDYKEAPAWFIGLVFCIIIFIIYKVVS